jgi:hypothetical protein
MSTRGHTSGSPNIYCDGCDKYITYKLKDVPYTSGGIFDPRHYCSKACQNKVEGAKSSGGSSSFGSTGQSQVGEAPKTAEQIYAEEEVRRQKREEEKQELEADKEKAKELKAQGKKYLAMWYQVGKMGRMGIGGATVFGLMIGGTVFSRFDIFTLVLLLVGIAGIIFFGLIAKEAFLDGDSSSPKAIANEGSMSSAEKATQAPTKTNANATVISPAEKEIQATPKTKKVNITAIIIAVVVIASAGAGIMWYMNSTKGATAKGASEINAELMAFEAEMNAEIATGNLDKALEITDSLVHPMHIKWEEKKEGASGDVYYDEWWSKKRGEYKAQIMAMSKNEEMQAIQPETQEVVSTDTSNAQPAAEISNESVVVSSVNYFKIQDADGFFKFEKRA